VLGRREDEAERMIMNLSNFFRTSLTADPANDVRLAEEIKLQQLYLDIERVRFPERLNVEIDVPAELENARIPGLILQPLVENAIKYGVSRSTRPVTVSIAARALDGRIRLVVEDDGNTGGAPEPGHGVGLRNVCDRLDARFGRGARCESGPRKQGGWRVVLTMPLLFDDRG
jgi:two-component system, LytTR family, sensor kinase